MNSTYTVLANLGGGNNIKQHLDSHDELVQYMDDIIKRNPIDVTITKHSQSGKSQTIQYDWDGDRWVLTKKGDIKMEQRKLRAIIRTLVNQVITEQQDDDQTDKMHSTIEKVFTKLERIPEWNKIIDMNDRFKSDALNMFIEKLGITNSGYVQKAIKNIRKTADQK